MRLFLTRALEALRPTGHERIAFCFGTGERHLVKALEVQALLGDLRLVLEAMLPGFNRYTGAEAIGGRSDLYICRPTTGAKLGEDARPRAPPPRPPARRAGPAPGDGGWSGGPRPAPPPGGPGPPRRPRGAPGLLPPPPATTAHRPMTRRRCSATSSCTPAPRWPTPGA